jgi:hypothetical protein
MEEDPGPAGAGEPPSWESMRARIAAEPASTVEPAARDRRAAVGPAPVPAGGFPAEGRRLSVRGRAAGGWFWPALAASWLVALGLGAGMASLYRNSVPGAPVPNVYHFDLLPEGAHIRRAPDADAVVVPAPARRIVLVLTIADPGSFPEYRLHVLDRVGEPVAEVSGLQPSAKGTFNVELSRGHLPAGRYLLRLEGVAGTAREPVADYRLDLGYE